MDYKLIAEISLFAILGLYNFKLGCDKTRLKSNIDYWYDRANEVDLDLSNKIKELKSKCLINKKLKMDIEQLTDNLTASRSRGKKLETELLKYRQRRSLTDSQVKEVEKMRASGHRIKQIAASFKVSHTTICNALNKKGAYKS